MCNAARSHSPSLRRHQDLSATWLAGGSAERQSYDHNTTWPHCDALDTQSPGSCAGHASQSDLESGIDSRAISRGLEQVRSRALPVKRSGFPTYSGAPSLADPRAVFPSGMKLISCSRCPAVCRRIAAPRIPPPPLRSRPDPQLFHRVFSVNCSVTRSQGCQYHDDLYTCSQQRRNRRVEPG